MSFMGGEYLIFLIKKSENFARAVYLVTNFLSDNEPLKWRLRTSATELIDRVMSFIREEKNKANEHIYRAYFVGCLSSLILLLNVGEQSGAISEANTELLKREIVSFFPIFKDKIFSLRIERIALPTAGRTPTFRRQKASRRTRRGALRESKRAFTERLMSPLQSVESVQDVLYNSDGQDERARSTKMSVTRNTSKTKPETHFERQKAIVSVLKDKKKLTVRELMSFIKDCGEKTIQRELVELVGRGILKKMGAKRWSAYAFVQPLLFEGGEKHL